MGFVEIFQIVIYILISVSIFWIALAIFQSLVLWLAKEVERGLFEKIKRWVTGSRK